MDDDQHPLKPLTTGRLDTLLRQPFLATSEVAELLRVSPWTCQNAYRCGALEAVKVGKYVRHSRAQVDRYIEALSNGTG